MRRLAQIDLQPTPVRCPLTGHLAPEKETRRDQPNSRLEHVIRIEYKEEMIRKYGACIFPFCSETRMISV
jgi:hypothetical protein